MSKVAEYASEQIENLIATSDCGYATLSEVAATLERAGLGKHTLIDARKTCEVLGFATGEMDAVWVPVPVRKYRVADLNTPGAC